MNKTASKAAPKKVVVKLADTACHYRKGGWAAPDYRAKGALAECKEPRLPKKNHCARHEAEYVKAAKLRAAAREAAAPARPKAAPKAARSTKAVAKNSGGATRRSVPPVQLHPAPVPVVRVNAPDRAPALVQLVTGE